MILELLINLFFGLVNMLLNLIPDITLPSGFINGFSSVRDLMEYASYLIPIGVFVSCLSVFFILHNITMIISIFNWIIRKIPGVS